MKNIIIVGTGKAALLHYNSYNKIKEKGKIFFVDIINKSKYIKNVKIYSSINHCVSENNLDVSKLIVDICTPVSEFYNILDVCYELNIKDILVEKPFINKEKYNNMNIIMVQNYLYSKVTSYIKKYIEENNMQISMIYTNFSKNRIIESSNGRGFNKKVTLNYEIEIPHQIYLTRYFINNKCDSNNLITCARDMKIGDLHLKNHGYGLIISKVNDVDIIYESNLTSNIAQKKIIICTKDNYSIEGNYALYSESLKLIKSPNITIFKDGRSIKKIAFKSDDNFAKCINQVYKYFNNKDDLLTVDLNMFSKELLLYITNLLERKSYDV